MFFETTEPDYYNRKQKIYLIKRLDDEKGTISIPTLGGHQVMLVSNEYGLHSLALASTKPQAKKFKK